MDVCPNYNLRYVSNVQEVLLYTKIFDQRLFDVDKKGTMFLVGFCTFNRLPCE